MTTIREYLRSNPHPVWHITPEATVYEALQLLAEKDIGALPVLAGDRVVGMFSERDYARKVILMGRSSRSMPVSELMTAPVLYVRPEQTIDDCMALISEKRVRHLPVLAGDKLVGMITIGDVVRAIISEQEYTIDQLENYITGGQ